MGRHTSEALGDYCAGPNHVLPTSGTARFSSPLGVYDFQKRSSIIFCSEQGASDLGKTASILARGESLTGHARSAEYRIIADTEQKGLTGVLVNNKKQAVRCLGQETRAQRARSGSCPRSPGSGCPTPG